MKPVALTPSQARRIALASQGLGRHAFGRGLAGTRAAIAHLGYVQIDTISVVERAHHHVLFNRVPGYRPQHLDKLVAERSVLDYWAHAASYVPMRDYRFCLPRMHQVAQRRRHFFGHDEKLAREILARVRSDGALRAGDFTQHRGSSGMWQWSPVKRAIEYLFLAGELSVTRRENFQKVFDLPERVIPPDTDQRMPDTAQYARHLVDAYLRAHGVARRGEFGYLRQVPAKALANAVDEAIEAGQVLPARIRGDDDFLLAADFEQRLAARQARRAWLLSPFDNLVIQRERLRRLFDFDYQLECYLPAARRRFGYFCLPLLWRGAMVGRLDAKAHRAEGVFQVHALHLEPRVRKINDLADDLADDLARALRSLAGCRDIDAFSLEGIEHRPLARALTAALNASQAAGEARHR